MGYNPERSPIPASRAGGSGGPIPPQQPLASSGNDDSPPRRVLERGASAGLL